MSSSIADIHYDPVTKLLIVAFVKGGNFTYREVPEAVYQQFVEAPSKGQYFKLIAEAHATKLEGEDWQEIAAWRLLRVLAQPDLSPSLVESVKRELPFSGCVRFHSASSVVVLV